MSILTLETQQQVAIITLNNGENRHNPAFASSLLALLAEVLAEPNHKALVIRSSDPKNWSLGIDTDWLLPAMQAKQFDQVKQFMYQMDQVFKTLLSYPLPVIAEISGHAFGNGAILACACDFRMMRSDKGYFCFPEIDLSIPFLPGMLAFVKKAVPFYRLNEMMLTGRRVTADELAKDHIIEQAFADNQALMAGTLAFAQSFNKKRAIFAEQKKRAYKDIIECIDTENPPLIDSLKLLV